jgi:hypothetical protein
VKKSSLLARPKNQKTQVDFHLRAKARRLQSTRTLKYGRKSLEILLANRRKADFRGEFRRIIANTLKENGMTVERDDRANGQWEGKREGRHYIHDSSVWHLPKRPEYNDLLRFGGVKYTRGFAEPFDYLGGRPATPNIKELVEADVIVARKR